MKVINTMTNQIEVDKELFTALEDSRGKDIDRDFMNYSYYEKSKNRISATDGRRIFIYNLTESNKLEEGFYISVKEGKKFCFFREESVDGQYPNIDRVIPDYRLTIEHPFVFCSKLCNCAPDLFRLFITAGPVNPDFLKPIYGIRVNISYTLEPNKAITIHDESKIWQYIVMPMQHDHDAEAHNEAIEIFKAKFVN